MPDIRSAAEIFEDLRHLCRKPGFLHAISSINSRDFFVSVDLSGGISRGQHSSDPRSQLNHNELMLLVGLLVQSDTSDVFAQITDTASLVSEADSLLEELHTHLEGPMRDMLQNRQAPDAFGSIAKEAIYYGADSAFAPQYKRFARNRYRDDFAWLLANRGLSIRPMIEIASYIVHCVNQQLTALFHQYSDGPDGPASQYISGALLVAKHALIKQFGEKGESFLDLFSIPITHSNTSFITPFVYNEVNSKPLLDLRQHVYVSSQYRLFESIYESPYYWMLADPHYRDIASANRGRFLEQEIARMMRSVFGRDHVFTNVVIKTRKHQIAAEADVLVAYGEFLLVVQAKSKRLTLAAKAGDLSKINDDFQAAIQSAYDQAIKFYRSRPYRSRM